MTLRCPARPGWREDLSGRGVIADLQSTLTFESAGRVLGNAGCSRYPGPVAMDGEGVRFGDLGATRMMCPAAIIDQEQKFFIALGKTKRFGFGPPGIMTLYDARAHQWPGSTGWIAPRGDGSGTRHPPIPSCPGQFQ